ncbi:putative response regulator in two-component system with YpdA [Escherichia coli]|nr:putative response regulator in two-component system with YpdA [Escherichia coli]
MKVIIVEDEFLAQQELSWLIKEHSQMEIVGTFDDGLDVLKFLQHKPRRRHFSGYQYSVAGWRVAGAKHQPVRP